METNQNVNEIIEPQKTQNPLTKVIVAILAVVVVFMGVAIALLLKNLPSKNTPQTNSVQNLKIDTSAESIETGLSELSDREVFFAGIPDGSISKGSPLLLSNPESNEDIFLKYTIYEEGETVPLFETDLIESGKHVDWVISDFVSPGEHTLVFEEQPYYATSEDGWLPLTKGRNTVKITVLEE